jgi:type IV pilus assembly protein PilV
MQLIKRTPARARAGGFSLIEVMVAVLVISIGLLGIAKMQALALSNTGNSRVRALAALEAASLTSIMQADRTYWTGTPVVGTDLVVTLASGSITSSTDATLTTMQNCASGGSAPCTAAEMAAYDLQLWSPTMTGSTGVIPNGNVNIDCNLPAAGSPVTCTVTFGWNENLVNSNAAETTTGNTTALTALATPAYVFIVQP